MVPEEHIQQDLHSYALRREAHSLETGSCGSSVWRIPTIQEWCPREVLTEFSLRGWLWGLWSDTWEVDSIAWNHERLLRGDPRMVEMATVWETGWGRRVY